MPRGPLFQCVAAKGEHTCLSRCLHSWQGSCTRAPLSGFGVLDKQEEHDSFKSDRKGHLREGLRGWCAEVVLPSAIPYKDNKPCPCHTVVSFAIN